MIIGVTGSLATGKTTVSRMLKELGAYVIDADKIVHGLIDQAARIKLRGVVFDDKESLDKLCEVIHPIVKKEILRKIRENKSRKMIAIDAPLLIESGFHKKMRLPDSGKIRPQETAKAIRECFGPIQGGVFKKNKAADALKGKDSPGGFYNR